MPKCITITILIGISALATVSAVEVRGDYVTLRSGGEVRGEVQVDARARSLPELITIRTLSGASVAVSRAEVASVVRRRLVLEEYETLRRSAADTRDAQWELAEWCRKKSLMKERETHLRAVVIHDPEHAQARRALGHTRDKRTGEWFSQDEMMAARGYVKHKGRYILPQVLEQMEEDARESEAEKAWFRKVKMWKSWLDSERADRRAEAHTHLEAITSPDAVAALSRSFKDVGSQDRRLMYIKIIGRIEGEKPVTPLVLQSLWDESEPVREAAVAGLRLRDLTKAIPLYLRALRNRTNVVVNRAGDALAQLGTEAVMPQLIEALVTKHTYIELVPEPGLALSADGGMVPAGPSAILPPHIEALLATGQLPYGVRVEAPANPVRMKEITYEKDENNESVLAALRLLSGEDFGFDEAAWRRWYSAFKNAAVMGKRKKPKS
jgi:hypothetical protein